MLARLAAALLLPLAITAAFAQQDGAIRKTLAERLPKLPPINEVVKSPIPGLWEVRFGDTEILYTDDKAEFILIGGSMVETKTRTDLTEQRINQITAIPFDQLPLKDAITIKQGAGSRQMAVFVDPNCGFCKQFERDLAAVKDVTIHTFLIPILGADSNAKSRDIWCAKEPAAAWRAWMLEGVLPSKAAAKCDTAPIERNLAFSRKQRINGTPAVFFSDGVKKPGAIPGPEIEKLLAQASKAPAPVRK